MVGSMTHLKKISYFFLAVAIAMEMGSIIFNLGNGYSSFDLNSDVLSRFSLDNKYFLLYWGALLGLFFILTDIRFKNNSQKEKSRDSASSSIMSVIEKITDTDRKSVKFVDHPLGFLINVFLLGAVISGTINYFKSMGILFSIKYLVISSGICFFITQILDKYYQSIKADNKKSTIIRKNHNSVAKSIENKKTHELEEKLANLKSLHKKGLISSQAYEAQQKKLLEKNAHMQ